MHPVNNSIPTPPAPSHVDDEGKIDFRTTTVLVQVPVVVTDKSHHLQHLTQEKFRVLENGKEQKIAAFEEVVADNSSRAVVQPSPGIFRNLNIDTQHRRSVVVIAIDTVNTPFLDQASARRELLKFLADNLDSGQTVAMVLIGSHGLKIIQELTTDPTALISTLKKLGGELPAMQGVDANTQATLLSGNDTRSVLGEFARSGDLMYAQFKQAQAIETTMRAFLEIAWSLSGVPGRKCLIWATGGFPFNLESPSATPGGRLSTVYERTMQALNDAQVSVYPVDVRGLLTTPPASNSWLEGYKRETFKNFAEMTGGRAFYNSNDIAGGFRRAADDSASYYLLGYYLDTKNTRASWRRLSVKMREKDATAFARSGFLATNTTMGSQATRDFDFSYAVRSPLEATAIPIWMEWQHTGSRDTQSSSDKKKVGFALHIPGDSVATDGDENAIDLDFVAVVATSTGKSVGDPIQHPMKAKLSHDTLAKMRAQGMKYSSDLQLPTGSYEVRSRRA
jgi:VWFA-related protein